MSVVNLVKGSSREAPRSARSSMETIYFTLKEVENWVIPPFQRPLRVNEKVRLLAKELEHNGGFISGVITLGRLASEKLPLYIVDGQHRMEAFKLSGLKEGIADVRICTFDSIAEMADEFVLLQETLVRMKPDDVLRGLEGSIPAISLIRKKCPFVAYDNIRRSATNSPILGMAAVLRYWGGSRPESPVSHISGGTSTSRYAREIDDVELENLISFLSIAFAAWGRDQENFKLWNGLNLGLCMWLYRRTVLDQTRTTKRATVLTAEMFKKCLMSVSANRDYVDWLSGRILSDVHRSPAFRRLRVIFLDRMREDGAASAKMPAPSWVSN